MIESIDHVNLVVRNLSAMASFYCDVLGFQLTKSVTISGDWIDAVVGLCGVNADVIYLDLPAGPRIELIYYQSPASPTDSGANVANLQGLRHIAFRVTDIDETLERIEQAGVRLHSPIAVVPNSQVQYAGGARKRLVYFNDPEGNILEMCEYKA